MSPKIIGFAVITFLHTLFTVVWLGGMMVMLFAYMPAVKEALGAGPQTKKVLGAFKRKQRVWVWVSMAGLVITGMLMSHRHPEYGGLFSAGNAYSLALTVKHIIVLIMIGIALYRSIVLAPKAEGATLPAGGPGAGQGMAGKPGPRPGQKPQPGVGGPSPDAARREKLNFILLVVNVALAVVVLFNSAVVAALGAALP